MILLERGRLDVETAAGGVARITTDRFEVELEDASLTIEPAGVRVHRGAVRIVDLSGRAAVARIEAGGAWAPLEPAPAPPRSPASRGARSGSGASSWLAQARARFGARDYAAAGRSIEAALAAAPSRAEAAEARTLLADVALASGDLPRALERYLAVAARFAELPAAESALYAAARIELRRARPAEARALLERYLARYPSGRYADDARRQLTAIP
jgi:TolA-binding protein